MDNLNQPYSAPLQNGQAKGAELRPTFESLIDPNILSDHMQNIAQKPSNAIADRLGLAEIRATDKIEPPPIAWKQEIEGQEPTILGTLGNFSLIIGKAKSRKSFFINIAVSAVLNTDGLMNQFKGELPEEKGKVLYFDTEQGKYHVQQALHRICRQIGVDVPRNLQVFGLRKEKPSERLAMIDYAIKNTKGLGFVVIDGIKDLITSINDEEEATMIASKLLKWSEEFGIHIIVVLHQNKGDNNARGHIGTELQNKAETVLSVSKNEQVPQISIVKSEFCRNQEPEPFAFEIIDGLPVVVEDYDFSSEKRRKKDNITEWPDAKIYELLNIVFSRVDNIGYSDLVDQLKNEILAKYPPVGINKVKELITHCKAKGWLIQENGRGQYKQGKFESKESG